MHTRAPTTGFDGTPISHHRRTATKAASQRKIADFIARAESSTIVTARKKALQPAGYGVGKSGWFISRVSAVCRCRTALFAWHNYVRIVAESLDSAIPHIPIDIC